MGRHPLLPPPAVTCLGQGPLLSWARLSWGWRMVSKLDNRKQRVGLSGQQGRRTGSLPGRGDPAWGCPLAPAPGGLHARPPAQRVGQSRFYSPFSSPHVTADPGLG